MKNLKPVHVLTQDAIWLLERVKMHLETYNHIVYSKHTEDIIKEFSELIDEVKN